MEKSDRGCNAMARKIEVVDYRPEWEKMFKKEKKEIRRILGKNCVAVYHIGSTSVKGLPAKPIIDIMPVVKDLSLVDAHNPEFEALGYECRGEFGIPGRRFFAKGGDHRTHHIHIFEQSDKDDIRRHLAVRDYLRSHPDDAAEYAALKKELAEKFPYDNDGYCDGKDAFVKDLEQKALKWMAAQEAEGTPLALGICMGLCLGTVFGTIFNDMGFWIPMGLGLGVCFGAGAGAVMRRPPKSDQ